MGYEVTEHRGEMPTQNMHFDKINQGTVAVESSRAIAEAQGKLIMAKRFPRSYMDSHAKALEACRRKSFAEKAFFSYPRSGQTVTGVTIRFAEELARCYGILLGLRDKYNFKSEFCSQTHYGYKKW